MAAVRQEFAKPLGPIPDAYKDKINSITLSLSSLTGRYTTSSRHSSPMMDTPRKMWQTDGKMRTSAARTLPSTAAFPRDV